jgi:hypothetical protein
VSAMSQEVITLVLHALFRSSHVRARFSKHPLAVLAELQCCAGVELTLDDMRALAGLDPGDWSAGERIAPRHVH